MQNAPQRGMIRLFRVLRRADQCAAWGRPAETFLGLFLLLATCAGRANTAGPQDEMQPLEVGRSVDANLVGGQAKVYELFLSSSQFLRFTVSPRKPVSNIEVG